MMHKFNKKKSLMVTKYILTKHRQLLNGIIQICLFIHKILTLTTGIFIEIIIAA